MKNNIYPILLAGGSGTRLWPVSRKSYPKQFVKLLSHQSLFQQSALRLTSSEEINFLEHLTVTNVDFRFLINQQLQSVGVAPGKILIEPEGKNTAPAILAACIFTMLKDPESILIVCPSDHVIPDKIELHKAIAKGIKLVEHGKFVTFGIEPNSPETGFGYLELAQKVETEPVKLIRFIEKPDIIEARAMLNAQNFLWNSGIFLFRARDMVNSFEMYFPELVGFVKSSIEEGKKDLGFFRLAPGPWSQCPEVSIDHAIMEKADNLFAVPFNSKWSDVGNWNAVWKEQFPNEDSVVEHGSAMAIDCTNTLLRSDSKDLKLVGLGLDNIIAIAMSDAVLVANKDKVQDVKKVVSTLKERGVPQAEELPTDYRPWGWFETLITTSQFKVKRIYVGPGCSLSLQSHKYRSEHWVVVEGTATVTVDREVKDLHKGQSVNIPQEAAHRLENNTQLDLYIIEVQTGTYFGEDDITRYSDLYSRS